MVHSPALRWNYDHNVIESFDISGITYFSKVTLDLDQEFASDRCSSEEEATEAAYKVLWEKFCISAPAEGKEQRLSLRYNEKNNYLTLIKYFISIISVLNTS